MFITYCRRTYFTCGYAGMGSTYPHPHTRLPDGYMMLSIDVPTGRLLISYPSPYRVKPVRYSGFGYPLSSLDGVLLRAAPDVSSPGAAHGCALVARPACQILVIFVHCSWRGISIGLPIYLMIFPSLFFCMVGYKSLLIERMKIRLKRRQPFFFTPLRGSAPPADEADGRLLPSDPLLSI
jgi:hypothetical protein